MQANLAGRLSVAQQCAHGAFIGPSGCSKETLRNILAGMKRPESAPLQVDGQERMRRPKARAGAVAAGARSLQAIDLDSPAPIAQGHARGLVELPDLKPAGDIDVVRLVVGATAILAGDDHIAAIGRQAESAMAAGAESCRYRLSRRQGVLIMNQGLS